MSNDELSLVRKVLCFLGIHQWEYLCTFHKNKKHCPQPVRLCSICSYEYKKCKCCGKIKQDYNKFL